MSDGDITRLLAAAGSGDRAAFDRFYQAVYAELHRIALARMRQEGGALTLQPTALVNETYLRLLPAANAWDGRGHFFSAAAQAMRRILVDHARHRQAQKRGGEFERVTLTGLDVPVPEREMDVLLVDEAVEELGRERPRLAELVSLRVFAGLSIEEAAQALQVSPATVKRDWAFARAWLHERIQAQRNAP
jgi:RNA polymerase sigma factor (TIGR02999 family)